MGLFVSFGLNVAGSKEHIKNFLAMCLNGDHARGDRTRAPSGLARPRSGARRSYAVAVPRIICFVVGTGLIWIVVTMARCPFRILPLRDSACAGQRARLRCRYRWPGLARP